jgi:hypothetical protein
LSKRHGNISHFGLILHDHISESRFHLTFNKMSFFLHFSHLLLHVLYTFFNYARVKEAFHLLWVHLPRHERIGASGSTTTNRVLLERNDLFKLINFRTDICGASPGVLVQELHLIKLLVDWLHHLEHHASVFVEHILFQISRAIGTCCSSIHHIVDDVSNLLLIILQHINLLFHHLGLPVHEALWHLISILLRDVILPHFVNKCAHFLFLVLGHFFHLILLETHCGCHLSGWLV